MRVTVTTAGFRHKVSWDVGVGGCSKEKAREECGKEEDSQKSQTKLDSTSRNTFRKLRH